MTIEKIIEIYNEPDRIGGNILRGNSEENTKYNSETMEALQSINVILHKYQKIQEIVRWNNAPSPYYKPDGQLFREIIEVLDDGNDN